MVNTMRTIPIDKAGRLVLPRMVRSRLHVRAGDRFEVDVGPNFVTLRPLHASAAGLVRHKTRMVWDAPDATPDGEVFESAIRRGREERDQRASGLD